MSRGYFTGISGWLLRDLLNLTSGFAAYGNNGLVYDKVLSSECVGFSAGDDRIGVGRALEYAETGSVWIPSEDFLSIMMREFPEEDGSSGMAE